MINPISGVDFILVLKDHKLEHLLYDLSIDPAILVPEVGAKSFLASNSVMGVPIWPIYRNFNAR